MARIKSKAKSKLVSSSDRVRTLISTAYSTFHNSRNLEVEYYTAYMLALDEVANIPDHGTVIARQQPNLWLSKESEDSLPMEEIIARYPDGYSDDEGDRDAGELVLGPYFPVFMPDTTHQIPPTKLAGPNAWRRR